MIACQWTITFTCDQVPSDANSCILGRSSPSQRTRLGSIWTHLNWLLVGTIKYKHIVKSLSWLPSWLSPLRSTDHDALQSWWHREQLLDSTFWRRHQPLHHYDLLQVIITNILHKIILVTTSTLANLSSSSPSPSHYPHHSQLHPCQHVSELWNDHLLALVLCQVRPSRGRPFQAALPSSDQNL